MRRPTLRAPARLFLCLLAAGAGLVAPAPAAPAAADPAAPVPAATVSYQAEDATLHQAAVATNHAGYTGTGFVDYVNATGGYVEFAVTADQAGPATLTFRYANGTSANRAMDIAVDGSGVRTGLAFPGTGAWTTWTTATVTATLAAGTHTVRATATTADGGPNLDALAVTAGSGATDWSVAMVESTMSRFTPSSIGGWSYPVGLYLLGQYQVYQRTHDPRYLAYVKTWVDRFVDSGGAINQSFNSLDSMLAGRLLVVMATETGDQRYRTAATTIRDRLKTYPRTADGGFWHATASSRAHQLWSDGAFMVNPFLAEYGKAFHDSTATDEAANQLLIYGGHLQQSNGLLKHAYDESRTASWADPTTGLAPEYWCRAVGWYGMAVTDILDTIPASHPSRPRLLTILRNLAAGLERFQDPATGRWFQVMDKGSRGDNWTETSCSSMFTFTLSRGVEQGYLDGHYASVAARGYQGVLARLSLDSAGLTELTTISIGTNVGDYAYYVGRTQATNDLHGLGAFLLMNEQLGRK